MSLDLFTCLLVYSSTNIDLFTRLLVYSSTNIDLFTCLLVYSSTKPCYYPKYHENRINPAKSGSKASG